MKSFIDLLFENKELLIEETKKNPEWLCELYASLCNTDWVRLPKNKEEFVDTLRGEDEFGVSWRSAGGICAEIYNQTFGDKEWKDYMDYYCSGNEGVATPRIHEIAAKLGFKIRTYPVSP